MSKSQFLSTSLPSQRPYRSHKNPACDRCRKRKLRCVVDLPGQPCLLCRLNLSVCDHGSINSKAQDANDTELSSPQRASKRRRQAPEDPTLQLNENVSTVITTCNRQIEGLDAKTDSADSSIVVGPMVAEDVRIFQQCLPSSPSIGSQQSQPYNIVSDDPRNPILYLKVPRRREGLKLAKSPGKAQLEILEQILGPYTHELIAIYFKYIHPCFPILDEQSSLGLHKQGEAELSPTLICELYASSLIFWDRSDILRYHHRPDIRYAWNTAVTALQDDFLAPSLSTVQAAIIDLFGRPIYSIMGNIINIGRTVSLAHSLGLNRDPRTWRGSTIDKHIRIRLWWGVLINDCWAAMAHGTPPNINSNQYDVPVPELSMLLTSGKESGERKRAAECFISLCMLSELLGEILTLVYCLKIDHREISRRLRDLETALDKWENCLPSYLKVSDHGSVDSTSVSGSCSLRTGYLSIKMLLCRVALREATHLTDIDVPEAIHYRLAKLRQAAGDIVIFICSLKEHHLKEFWLPYTAYHLASAAIILLRCAVDTKDPVISESCKTKLRLFRDQLRKAKDKNEWDLADIFLARCEEPIIRITINAPSLHQDITRELNDLSTTNVDNGLSTINTRGEQNESPWLEGSNIPDILSIPNSDAGFGQLEYPWANLWDMLDVNNNTF